MKKLSIITAIDPNGLIGNSNKLPWCIREDLKYFKKTTIGHPIVMGRKTYDSCGYLPHRDNIILSNNSKTIRDKNATMISTMTFDNFLEKYNNDYYDNEVFVIGGREIYKLFLPIIDKLYITEVLTEYKGDVWFPDYNKNDFELIHSDKREKCNFNIYNRIK